MKEEMKSITGEETLVLQEPQTTKEQEVLFEDTSKRSANVKHFCMKDGSFMAAIYDKPVHYMDDKTGKYKEIPHDFAEEEDCYVAQNHRFKATFPKKWGKKKYMTMERNGQKVRWRFVPTDSHRKNPEVTVRETAKAGKLEVAEFPSMSYAGAEAYVDVEYIMTDNGVKENLVVNKAPRKKAPCKFRFSMEFGDLTPVLSEDKKQIDLMDGQELVLQIPKPNMSDAAGAYSEDGYYELQKEADGSYMMTLIVSEEWMQDSMRAFPVVVDPQIKIPGYGEATLIWREIRSDGTAKTSDDGYYMVGTDTAGVEHKLYGTILGMSKIELPEGCLVTGATLRLYQDDYENTGEFPGFGVKNYFNNWTINSITWDNQPSTSGQYEDVFQNVQRDETIPITLNLTSFAKSQYSDKDSLGFVIEERGKVYGQTTVSSQDGAESGGCNCESTCTTCTLQPNYVKLFSKQNTAGKRPVLTIQYQATDVYADNQETYCFSAGRAGTGYINLLHGALSFVHADVATSGNQFPMAVSHIYQSVPTKELKQEGYGYGWFLSATQKIYDYVDLANSNDTDADTTTAVGVVVAAYRDAGGHYHYFVRTEDENGEISCVDAGGLGLKYECFSNGIRHITDANGSVMEFRSDGKLEAFDVKGLRQEMLPVYENRYVYSNNMLSSMADGDGHIFSFTNEESLLKKLSAFNRKTEDGETTYELEMNYYYNSDETLRKISYGDGERTKFTYFDDHRMKSVTDQNGLQYLLTYDELGRVKTLTQLGTYSQIDANGSDTEEDIVGMELEFSYGFCSTVVKDVLTGKKTVYRFGDTGKVTCVYEDITDVCCVPHDFVTPTIVKTYDSVKNRNLWPGPAGYPQYCSLSVSLSGTSNTATNFITNGIFTKSVEGSTLPTGWSFGSCDAQRDGLKNTRHDEYLSQGRSCQIDNTVKTQVRNIQQNISMTGKTVKGNVLVASAWAKATHPVYSSMEADSGVRFELHAKVYYTSGSPQSYIARFDSARTDWQYAAVAIPYSANISGITIYLEYSGNEGKCLFSNVRLTDETGTFCEQKHAGTGMEETISVLDGVQVPIYRTITTQDRWTTLKEYQDEKYRTVRTDITDKKGNTFTSYNSYLDMIDPEVTYSVEPPDETALKEGPVSYTYFQKSKDYRGNITKSSTKYKTVDEGLPDFAETHLYHSDDENSYFYEKTKYWWLSNDVEKEHHNINGTLESRYQNNERGWLAGIRQNNSFSYNYTYHTATGALATVSTDIDLNKTTDEAVKTTNAFSYTKGLLTRVTHNAFPYHFVYDGLGRIKSILVGSQTLINMSYERDGETQIQTIDYATNSIEEKRRFEIISDACGNPIMKKYNGTILSTATYDAFGRPVRVVDNAKNKTYNYTYDRYGNVICVKETDNKTGSKVENTFVYPEGEPLNTKTYGATGHTYTMLYEEDDAGHRYPDNVVVGVTLQDKFTDKVTRDSFGRMETRTLENANGSSILEQEYQYATHDSSDTKHKTLVSCIDQDHATLRYTYDDLENIKTVSDGNTLLAEYHYDALNRLVQEDNYQVNRKYTWNYDKGGNITSKAESVLSDTGNTCIASQTYTYRGSVWKDQLISYNGTSIVYDEMGNPTTYKNQTLQWIYGRNLRRYGNNTFAYGADNIRYKKNDTVYTLDGSTILQETDGTKTITYYYGNGGVIGFNYNGADYYFEKNLQGDVIALLDKDGYLVAKYVYDAWGKILLMKDKNGNDISNNTSHIGYINPIRYRSYYYDVETNLYYLESRYYDPETGRFLNADSLSYLGEGSDLQNYNLYSYCENNPVMYSDPSGQAPEWWQWALFGVGIALVAVAAGMAIIGTGGTGAFGLGALIGSAGVGVVGAGVGAAIGYATGGADGILGGLLTGFGIGAIVGFVIGGTIGYYNYHQDVLVREYISKYARNADDANDILNSFEGKIRLKTSRGKVNAYRYYDDINAFARGRYLTNATTANPIDDLVLYNNNATYLARWNLPKGTQYLTGKIAGSPIGAIQYFVGNASWLVLF